MKPIFTIALLMISFACTKVNAQAPTILFDTVITGLSQPMQVVHAGDGTGRIFIVQKGGGIRVYNKDYSFIGSFLVVTGISTLSERGLLSMAFHPDYKNNGLFYVYYANAAGDLVLARYRVSANPNVADTLSRVILKTIPHPGQANHNGGELHFGPEGYLYLSTGDGGGSGDVSNNAQNTSVLLGKMLRFAVDTTSTPPYYAVPADNPFGNEVYDYGLRNPFRWSFDRLNYDMWIGDVGQDAFEEVDRRRYDSTNGINFGWRCYEGTATYNTTGCGPIANYTFPIYTYALPTGNISGSITGGLVYRGESYPGLYGYYMATDYTSGRFYMIKYDSVAHTYDTSTQAGLAGGGIVDFGETEEGEVYATNLNNGRLLRIVSSGPVQYIFTGNGNWNVATNWIANKVPPAILPDGCKIVIRPVAGGECVLNVPQTVPQGTAIIVENDKQFRINGNLTVQ
jgi:glucose/arabinose dehydrogenase